MELLYSMRRKPLKCEPPHYESTADPEVTRPICTISTCNIIAFSSPTELTDSDGDTWGGHVYVCDLDTPWHSHKVTSTVHPVSALEWDCEGKHLLVATTVGQVTVFGQKDYLLNEWTCLYTANFPGEHIIKAAFFHNGRRLITVDKKPDAPITDRIQMLMPTPTLKGFGGVATEGACVVTATGLLGALTPADEGRALCTAEGLRPARDRVTAASIAHNKGNVVVACVCVCETRACVRCYVCSVRAGGAGGVGGAGGAGGAAPTACLLTAQPLPAIHLQYVPTCISWSVREEVESLIVAGAGGLAVWQLAERPLPVHKLLAKGPVQGSTTPGGGPKTAPDCFNTVTWQASPIKWGGEGRPGVGGAGGVGGVVSVGSSRLAVCAPLAVLATPGRLHLLNWDTQHWICSKPVITSGSGGPPAEPPAAGTTPPKKSKYGNGALPSGCSASAACVELSQLGGVCVCVDTHGQLHVYRLPQPDTPSAVSLQQSVSLLELGALAGFDSLDVLLAANPNMLDAIYDRVTENFQRQPASFQQFYYNTWLKLRLSVCRMVGGGESATSWLSAALSCGGAWAAAAAALRPDDKLDALAHLHDHSPDHDKVLASLEARAESLPEALPLAALRRQLVLARDTTLSALATLAATTPTGPSPAGHQLMADHRARTYEIWSDPTAVGALRKLTVGARAAGLGGDALSRALARLSQGTATRADLVEECASIVSQNQFERVWEALPRCCVCAPRGGAAHRPPYFEYGVEPESLRYAPEPPPLPQCDSTPPVAMDSIRYMYLGGGGLAARWRQCSRCGARALPAARVARHPLQAAHDARFLAACRCGGKWTLFSNV